MIVLSDGVLRKADRLLTDGKVTIVLALGRKVEAEVVGDSDTYRVMTFNAGGGTLALRCTCPAPGVCAHLLAVSRVVAGPWKP